MRYNKTMLALAGLAAIGMAETPYHYQQEKQPKKCQLPSCDKLTLHNGGYCCAEHCKQHREELKPRKK
jgi:hypothetical protein